MIVLDEDALSCDFAETYHIHNYRALPASLAATLAVGLRDDSRIKMKLSDRKASVETILLAGIMDRLSVILGGERATLIAKNFISEKTLPSYGFETAEDFDAAWAALGANDG